MGTTTQHFDAMERINAERMADPQPGDRFHELYDFWVKVIAREGDWVVSQTTMPGETWGWSRLDSLDEFRSRFARRTLPGYWVLYRDREAFIGDVPSGVEERAAWLAALGEERRVRLIGPSMDSAML